MLPVLSYYIIQRACMSDTAARKSTEVNKHIIIRHSMKTNKWWKEKADSLLVNYKIPLKNLCFNQGKLF